MLVRYVYQVCLGALLVLNTAGQATEIPTALRGLALDANLRNTADEQVRVSQFRGKPTVLIYEDRHAIEVNRPFKNALRALALEPGNASAVAVVAVANVSRFNFFPVRGFALSGVRDAERKARHPILIDWENTLTRPPWNLPENGSSVLVLSPAGEVLFARSGSLSSEDQAEVFNLLQKFTSIQSPTPTTQIR
jgi:predicted transcriptional regulator